MCALCSRSEAGMQPLGSSAERAAVGAVGVAAPPSPSLLPAPSPTLNQPLPPLGLVERQDSRDSGGGGADGSGGSGHGGGGSWSMAHHYSIVPSVREMVASCIEVADRYAGLLLHALWS